MAGWSDTKTLSSREKRPYLSDEVDSAEFTPDDYKQIRLVGPVTSYAVSWNDYKNTKEGGKKTIRFPKYTSDYDRATGQFVRDKDPYRKGGMYFNQRFLTNIIDRELQENKPKKLRPPTENESKRRKLFGEKFYLKEKGSKTYTFYRVWDLPPTVRDKIVALTDLWHKRRVKAAKGKKVERVELSDPEHGCDLLVKFDPEAAGTNKWDVQLAEPTALTSSEKKALMYDIEHLKSIEPEPLEVAKQEWQRLKKTIILKDKDGNIKKVNDADEDEDEDEDFEATERSSKKKKAKKSGKVKDKVKSKTKDKAQDKPKKKKAKSAADEDAPPWQVEKPKKAKKSAKSAKSSSQKAAKAKKKKADRFDLDDDLE